MDDRLATLTVQPDATIRDTMNAIDLGGVEIALVADEHGRLIGTVSDGDIRRALLGGHSLDDTVQQLANPEFRAVTVASSRAEVLDLMQAFAIAQIPVVDDAGQIVGLHVLHELIGRTPAGVPAVVMAGGQGTRLRPITERIPKPMVKVAGRPILERIVLHLVGAGVTSIYVAVNYMADVIEAHFDDGKKFGCEIAYLREDPHAPLGTAGALTLLPRDLVHSGTPLLVMNGDLLTDVDVAALLAHHEREAAFATIGVRPYHHQVPFGVVELDDGRVRSMTEKPTPAWLVNAGVYVVDGAILERLETGVAMHMPEVLGRAIGGGDRVVAFSIDGDWLDVGRPEELRAARGET